MTSSTTIEWTDATWNPVAGCTVLSPGCTNCYAMRMAGRLEAMGSERYHGLTRKSGGRQKWTGRIKLNHDALDAPFRLKKPSMIFVNSMSDLFHDDVPVEFIRQVFDTIRDCPQHSFQILTKRSDRLRFLAKELDWHPNIWLGVSIESDEFSFRADDLRNVPAHIRFLSMEPLIGPIPSLTLAGIHWVIAGGESGPYSRPIDADWVRAIRDKCVREKVAFHFKQWGGTNKKASGRILDGRRWDEWPNGTATSTT